MLDKYLNKKVTVVFAQYSAGGFGHTGVITSVDDDFIELDNRQVIAIKYILRIILEN